MDGSAQVTGKICGSVGRLVFFGTHPGNLSWKGTNRSPRYIGWRGPSWSKTLSTSSCWPSLGMISSTNAFEPLATPPAPKLLQVTGSKMSAARRRNAVAVPARSVDVDEELLETERFPEFRNDLCWPLRRLSVR
ncbi:uncharacterized protein LOC6053886 [Culex quinquefasciatus]|uniref:uncharacterized protein LOC6053886 n=1 Tax=Culex quinquefasciatus TaxID=7176 RepID=UPI0018E3EBD1|nr:uncharacterized protein LOC6053886 [Culex quinquefasciatus]